MENKVFYKGDDISLILIIKIEHVVRILAEQDGISFEQAYERFIGSDTHRVLMNPNTLLWTESSEFIVDELKSAAGRP